MPVVARPSEYQKNFQWNPSKKSRSYSPPLAVLKPAAGVKSEIAAKASEPSITSKKKVIPPFTSKYMTAQGGDVEEYMLLGNSDKFSSNIKYRTKSRDRGMNLLKKSREENGDTEESPPPAPRPRKSPPKVKYDPGAPVLKAKKSDIEPRASKSQAVQKSVENNGVLENSKDLFKLNLGEHAPRYTKKPIKSTKEPEKTKKDSVKKPLERPPPQEKVIRPALKKDFREKRKGHMHESIQADIDKGVIYSQPEAPSDYAMKYKAGVAPPRPKGPKRLSEYAMQYQWKKGVRSSPLLAAEQIVYKSSSHSALSQPDGIEKASEYKKQFQPWHLLKSTPNIQLAVQEEESLHVPHHQSKKEKKHKRSRSLEDVAVERPAAGGEPLVSADDKRMIKESLNPQKLHFPHGKFKKYKSEYESNYAPPNKFGYSDGAWRGANPPHIAHKTDKVSNAGDAPPSSTWFLEVLELRQRAQEYKKRALGTHFSKEHVGQLYSESAEVWDTESMVSALSLETTSVVSGASQASSRRHKHEHEAKERKSRKSAWKESKKYDDDEVSSYVTSRSSMTPVSQRSERTLTPEKLVAADEMNGYIEDDEDSVVTVETPRVEKDKPVYQKTKVPSGRIPTPKLKEHRHKSGKNRHHLDRTTPSKGGTLLSAPLEKDSVSDTSNFIVSKQNLRRSIPAFPTNENASNNIIIPAANNKPSAYGKPTEDSHVLVDDETGSDHTLNLNFIKTKPQIEKEKESIQTRLSTIKEASGEYRSSVKSSEIPPPLDPQLSLNLADIPLREDEDNISFSARSIASSCSLASQVLERAKNRRDEFWVDNKAK